MSYEGRMWLPATPIIDKDDMDMSRSQITMKSIESKRSSGTNDDDTVIGNENDDMKYYYDYPLLNQHYQPQVIKSGKVLYLPLLFIIIIIIISLNS